MRITVLVENKAMDQRVRRAHGLSLYLEAEGRGILFDFGPRGPLLLQNAEAMGIDLAGVDAAVLSHGHYDHAGGLAAFLEVNTRAKVYIHRRAFLPHLSDTGSGFKDIGADPSIAERFGDRLVWTEGLCRIDENLTLFSDVPEWEPMFSSNRTLLEQEGTSAAPDGFAHEQNLLLHGEGKTALFGGCAHKGITNILRRAAEIEGQDPDAVFAGFHMTSPGMGYDEAPETVARAGELLRGRRSAYFTGHCTGEGPYSQLRELLGPRLAYMGCGCVFEL